MGPAARSYAPLSAPRPVRAYYQAFIIALVICWMPWKALAYAAAPLVLFWFVVFGRNGWALRRLISILLAAGLWIAVSAIIHDEFTALSALLCLVTYATAAVIFVVPARQVANPLLLARMIGIARWTIGFEAAFGIAQAYYGYMASGSFDIANGDLVQGTIYPYLSIDGAFANPMYSANMALLMIAIVPSISRRLSDLAPLLLACIALVLASVVHQLVFLLFSLAAAALLVTRRSILSRHGSIAAGLAATIASSALLLLPGNLSTFTIFIEQFSSGESPRAQIISRVVNDMRSEYPLMPLIGLGPGQFSSRAALISTGYYFGTPLNPQSSIIPTATPVPLDKYMMDLWLRSSINRYYGSTGKPFFSWLSLYTEFGAIAVVLVVALLVRAVRRIRQRTAGGTLTRMWVGAAAAAGILFVSLLGLQENYWEVPQALLPGCLLIKVSYAVAVHGPDATGTWQRPLLP